MKYTEEFLQNYRTPYADRAYTQDSWIRANIHRLARGGRRTGAWPKPAVTRKLLPREFLSNELESRGATPQAIQKQLEVRALTAIK